MSPDKEPDNHEEKSPSAGHGHGATKKRLTVVGIGASAGGLAALQDFFDALPDNSGMAFVVITHMDPERESLLAELLQSHTAMPVDEVTDLTAIEANHVYVIPPGRRIVVTDTHLATEPFAEPRGQRTPIDYFFRSLADAHREAVAIICSGGGTDGAVGVKAIKEEGGLLLVQDPDEAEHDSMPRAAIATGLADIILPVASLAEKLIEYNKNGVHVPRDADDLTAQEIETVYRILTQVQVQTGHDFSQYKRSTILRRIQRRMQLGGYRSLDAYLAFLRGDTPEAHALFNDLLIGVTNFFRDKDAWQAVADTVIPKIFAAKGQGDRVRVWSIGCATGEEAYSLAILLLEHAETLELPPASRPGIQIFASDLDDDALQRAREGIYPQAIEADVSLERLQRFFVKEDQYYRVRRELRDIVLFSNHSVLRDPPFSRLDLVSCRNLLIYLGRELQETVLEVFHYALNPEGYLFLGNSESAEMTQQFFRTLDKHHRLYQARLWRGERPLVPQLPLLLHARGQKSHLPAGAKPRRRSREAAAGELHQVLLEEEAPPSVIVDKEYQILHISETAGRYLLHPGGTVTSDLLKLVRPELQFELRTTLFQAFTQAKAVLSRPVLVRFNGTPHRVIVAVHPHTGATGVDKKGEQEDPGDSAEPLALVFFLEDEGSDVALEQEGGDDSRTSLAHADGDAQRDALLVELEGEVQRLRERLQSSTEEYESSNEELKAANEELQSINEEYRSTTEELETSKEELQSVNEELQTVNNELKNKLEEISRAHSDLENLMDATEIATLFLDRDLRIQRYTPVTAELFNIMPGDRGRPISHLTNKLAYDDLAADAGEVLHTLVPIEREIKDNEGHWLLARLRPYRTADHRIDGVVLTFIDIDELKATTAALREAKEYTDKIIHTVHEGLLVLKPDLTVEFANDSFYRLFAVDEENTVGTLVYDLGNGQWAIPKLRRLLEEILPEASIFNEFRVEHEFENVGYRVMLLNARRLDHVERILLAIEDITEREQYEQSLRELNEKLEERVTQRTAALRESEKRYQALVEAAAQMVWTTDAEGIVVEDSPSWRAYTGQSYEEWLGWGWLDAVHPDDRAFAASNWATSVENEAPVEAEFRLHHVSGEWRWSEARAVPLRDEAGRVRGWVGMSSDINARKKAEQERQTLAAQLTLAEHEERNRIAIILHDDLQQQLYAIQIQLGFLKESSGDDANREISEMEEAVSGAIQTTRRLSVDLSPPVLEGEGLAEAIHWLASQMAEQYGLDVIIEAEGTFPVPEQDRRVLLVQIVRELLFNAVKHAEVEEVIVRLQHTDDVYRLDVIDEGVGFDPKVVLDVEGAAGARGLLHTRERLRLIGGHLEVKAAPGMGTQITIVAPIHGPRRP